MITKTDMHFDELLRMQEQLVFAYGIHGVALAIMTIIDNKAEVAANSWQDIVMAKHWAACADAAVNLEAATLKEFGE